MEHQKNFGENDLYDDLSWIKKHFKLRPTYYMQCQCLFCPIEFPCTCACEILALHDMEDTKFAFIDKKENTNL